MTYIKEESTRSTGGNQGEPIKYTLYISTAKGKRRKWAGERETLKDIDILIQQNYLNKEFIYISANIVVDYIDGNALIERRYKKV